MTEIKVGDKIFVPYISKEVIGQRVCAIAGMINVSYKGKNPLLISILNGSFMFAADLFRELTIDAGISFIKLTSYQGTSSSGNIITALGLSEDIRDRHVIIVEDIIDTGKTLSAFLPELYSRSPASVKIATLLTKPEALKYNVRADYTGFEIEDKFVVGYGLDYNGAGRNLPGLYILKGG